MIAFNIVECRRLLGPLDIAALDMAVAGLVQRHALLRTRFRLSPQLTEAERHAAIERFASTELITPGTHELVMDTTAVVAVRVRDLRRVATQRQRDAVRDAYQDETAHPFDYTHAPLIRVRLLKCREDDHVLMVALPHLVVDLLSMAVLWRDLLKLYELALYGRSGEICPLHVDFPEFARWQYARYVDGSFEPSINYWHKQWARLATNQITPDDCDFAYAGAGSVATGACVESVSLDAATSALVTRTAREMRATASTVFLACYAALLQRRTGRSLLPIWIPMANRIRPGTGDMVGWLVNAHVVGIECVPDSSLHALVTHCRMTLIEALRHQEVPLQVVWHRLGGPQNNGPRLSFNFHRVEPASRQLSPLSIGRVDATHDLSPMQTAGFDLRVFQRPAGFMISAHFSFGRFKADTVRQVLEEYRRIVATLARDPSKLGSSRG